MARSRERILAALRATGTRELPLGEFHAAVAPEGDLERRFAEVLAGVGGELVAAAEGAGAVDALAALGPVAQARSLVSRVVGVASRHPGPAPESPTDLAELDVAVAVGRVAVAECAAVWVEPADTLGRAALFLAEHLVLVVPRAGLVATLHDGYAAVSPARAGYGCFVSGPSKTADIERALVVGAHGPRALTVLLHDGAAAPAGGV